jgi:uncharacterized protein (UPF0548 family)
MAISRAKSQAEAAEAEAALDALRKRAARQAAAVIADPAPPDVVECRVLKAGDGRVSMGIHIGAIGDAFYEKGEKFTIERSIATALENRGLVEIEGEPRSDD